jgi:serine/threonine protein kinase
LAEGPEGGASPEFPDGLEQVRLLGEGTTARVYLAREPELERLVAVKILKQDVAADATARLRFEREARSAARISHPNVTRIHRIGRLPDEIPYIVMEYVEGRTVRDVLESGGPLDPGEARGLLATVAEALEAAHRQGIIHRDIRPGNVFVENRSGRGVLGDFGIAALTESGAASVQKLTAVGVRLGEVRYMSPEQIRGEPVTEQSDVYSFGILAYEVLTGSGPYEGRSEARILAGHLQEPPRPLRELRAEVDGGTASLIEACLAKDPNRRPRTSELMERLSGAAGSGAGSAGEAEERPPEGSLARFLWEMKRRRVYQVLVAYGAVALAILGGAQSVYDAFELPVWSYQALVLIILGGFPVAMVLAWIYDITSSGIQRTGLDDADAPGGGGRALMWLGLGVSIAVAVGLAWWLLSGAS